MKTTNGCLQQEGATLPACWPECVEESYDRLISLVTRFTAADHEDDFAAEPVRSFNRFAL